MSCGTNDHFIPVGNPAPPRPRSPESFTSWIRSSARHAERLAQRLVTARRLVAVEPDDARVVPVRVRRGSKSRLTSPPRLEAGEHARGVAEALHRGAARRRREPRRARSAAINSRMRSGVTVSWFAKSIWTAGAKSHTPRHSSSWRVITPSSETLRGRAPSPSLVRRRVARPCPREACTPGSCTRSRDARPSDAAGTSCRRRPRPRPRPVVRPSSPATSRSPSRVTCPSPDCAR